jgi:CubicO group peptidase (beta-lactamase class C family)
MNAAAPALTLGAPQDVGLSPERLQVLEAVLTREIDSGKLPGAVVTLARRGQLVYHQALGRRDPAVDEPMQKDSIFRIYSMTKPVVSVAVMQMVEQGRLLLTQPIAQYLPELGNLQVLGEGGALEPARRAITVHDLLRHTAGFTYHFMGEGGLHAQYGQARLFARGYSNADFVKKLAEFPLMVAPGKVWAYSHATDVLGRLLEVLSGKTLGEHLKEALFDPLGMSETGFSVPPSQHHRIAETFERDPDTGAPMKLFDVREAAAQEMAGAGLVSTALDYARFMEMMLSGGALGEVRILSPKTVRLMTSDHLGGLKVSGHLLGRGVGFGLGFGVRLQDGIVPGAGSAGMYYWAGLSGPSFFIDPKEQLHAQLLIQQPGRRDYYRSLFRELVYASLID